MNESGTWSVSTGRFIGSLIGSLIGGALVGGVVASMIARFAFNQIGAEVVPTVIIGAVAGAVLVTIATVLGGISKVEVTPTEFIVHKGGREWRRWRRDQAAFSTNLVQHYRNGVKSGVTRTLTVTDQSGETALVFGALGRQAFTEVGNALNPITSAHARAGSGFAVPSYTYQVDRKKVASGQYRGVYGVAAVGVVLVALVGFLAWAVREQPSDAVVPVLIALAVLATPIVIMTIRASKRANQVPSEVIVDANGITVDATRTDYSSLDKIWLTPPTYTTGDTLVTLVDPNRQRRVLRLARKGKWAESFAEYEEFTKHLAHATANRPNMLAYELG